MNIYSFYGYKDFIICGGYKHIKIIKYFQKLHDFKFVKKTKYENILFKKIRLESKYCYWSKNYTGGRLLKIKNLIKETFFLTYGMVWQI